jgi:hypothetical protein
MVESTRQVRPRQRYGRTIDDPSANDPVPLFLAEQPDARYQLDEREEDLPGYQPIPEYAFAGGRKPRARGSRIVTGLFALSAAAAILAVFSVDSTRAVIVNAKASLANAAAVPAEATPPAPRITVQPVTAEPSVTEDAATTRGEPVTLASVSPSRDEIAAAYQSAIKTRTVAVEPPARKALQVAARRIDPDELAALLKRAKDLLTIGDISSARLLLERAADAQEADAALMLAGTFDPQVLGTQDMRSITPDPIAARLWYQKAAQLGSSDARRRLSQIQN